MKIKNVPTLCLLIITLFLSKSALSQGISISKGDIVKDRQFLIDKREITACDEFGNFISIRPHRINGTLRNYFIEFFDGLNFKERQEIETQNSTKILDIFIKNNKAHIFIKEHDKQNASLRIDLFDLNNKKLLKKELVHANKETNKNLYNAIKNDNSISLHHDEMYLLAFPVIEGKIMYTHVQYLNSDLNTTSSHKVYPNKDIKKKNTSFLNVSLYNNKAYILYSLKDVEDSNYYQLIEFQNEETRDLILPIDNNLYQLVNVKIADKKYIISGLFSKQKKGAFEGFVHYDVNLDTFKLTSNRLSNFLSENAQKYFIGLFKGNRSIDIKDLFVDKFGNIYLIGQCYSMKKQHIPIGLSFTLFESASSITYLTYNPFSISYKVYDDILISKIDLKGELIWDKIFELKQTEKINSKSNKKDSSYYAFLHNNQLHVLMNGFVNLEKDKLRFIQDKRYSKTNFYDIVVGLDGRITPNIIFPNANSEILFRADGSVKPSNFIYNLGQGNMRKQLLKLNLK